MHEGVDKIRLSGLTAHGFHGVFDHERRDGQEFTVDLVVGMDMRPAALSDDLAHTVDYGALAGVAHQWITGEPFDLIETLAERIAQDVLAQERVLWVTVTVHKPSAPIPHSFTDVAVEVTRSNG